MKKIFLAASLIVAAQLTTAQKIQWSAKVGAGLSNFYGDITQVNRVLSFGGGVQAEISFNELISLQPEILFSSEGSKATFHYVDETAEVNSVERIRLSYLNLPVLLKWSVSKRFSIEAGPQIGYLLAAKDNYEWTATITGATVQESGSADVRDSFRTFSFGAAAGSTFNVSEKIYLQLRAYKGFSNINKGEQPEDEEDPVGRGMGKITNAVLQLSVGYRF